MLGQLGYQSPELAACHFGASPASSPLAGCGYGAEETKSPAELQDEVRLATEALLLLLGELGLGIRVQHALQRGIKGPTMRKRGLIWVLWDVVQGTKEMLNIGPVGRENLRRALLALSKVETPLSDGRKVGEALLEIQATYEYARLFFALQDIKKAEEAEEALRMNASAT